MLSEAGQEINVGSLTRGRVIWPSICSPDRFIGPDGMAYPQVQFLKIEEFVNQNELVHQLFQLGKVAATSFGAAIISTWVWPTSLV